jgi:DNA-binding MarR family transcriptional regulator
MADVKGGEDENTRIMLGLLESVEQDGARSQRHLAAELGVALGLVNAYLRRCVTKGLVKISEAPARRYAYYLTPQGFAEKSRLTVEYLSSSFSFFRTARADCTEALNAAKAKGCDRIVLAGASDLAEIAMICALECGIEIVGVVDASAADERFLTLPVLPSLEAATQRCNGVLLTDLKNPTATLAHAVAQFGADRVFVPALLTGRMRPAGQNVRPAGRANAAGPGATKKSTP